MLDPRADVRPDDDVATEPTPDEPTGRLSPGARALLDWLIVVGVALLVAVLVKSFLLAHYQVEGTSMYSTLHPNDRVFVNKLSYRLHDPNRGDVVVLHEISGANERDVIKRVIALGGEEIEIRLAGSRCEVWVDEDPADAAPAKRLDEPYLDADVQNSTSWCEFPKRQVPEGHVFVMGDNRPGSHDSRAFGPVAHDEIVGRAFVVFWPRADWQWL